MATKIIRELIGVRFGKIVVQSYSEYKDGRHYWNCLCDCGKIKVVKQSFLITSDTKSCGCLIGKHITHGASYSYTYKSYRNMRKRCLQKTFKYYDNYGGRGIVIANRWLGKDGFKNFLEDMGERPKGLTLERKNNDGNYEPDNCKWATMKEQLNNTRRTKNNVSTKETNR